MASKDRAAYNAYMRKYMLDRYYRRLARAMVQLGGKCSVKGCKNKNLEIDHKNPVKKGFTITSRLAGVSEKKLQNELRKCQLLCVRHHIEKTVHELGRVLARGTHGTLSAYRYCKCSMCRLAHSEYSREYKKRRREMRKRSTPNTKLP